jgi:aminotransferase
MALSLSNRADAITQAEIRAMTIECDRVGGVNLAQGVCDTPPPPIVIEGAHRAMLAGTNTYTRYDGLADLRQAIAFKVKRDAGLDVDPETQITVSAGSTGAFYCACLSLLNPGDEVILFEPYYGYHKNTLLSVEAVPTFVPMKAPDWTFTREDLERVVTPRTRAIMVCTPGNPSGKVYSLGELRVIAEFAEAHDLFVFTDEIYEYFIYDGKKHVTPASLPGMAERTILISGYSKTFSITGWRVGYSITSPRWAQMIGYMNDLIYVCSPAPLQIGVAEGIRKLPLDYYGDLAAEYKHKRDLLCGTLSRIGLTPSIPSGAYYVLANCTGMGEATSKAAAMRLLRETRVASVPGGSFFTGPDKERFIRFCFAKQLPELEEACRRLAKVTYPVR